MKKNIWILNHFLSYQMVNQGGRHYWIAKYLKRLGYEPVVFGCNSRHGLNDLFENTDKLWIEKQADEISVPYILVNARPYGNNGKDRILNMIEFYINVQRSAKQYAKINAKPDVIYASSVHPLTLVAGIRLAKYFGVKCICEIRDLWPEAIFSFEKVKETSLLGKILVSGEHWIYRKADALVFTKEGDTDYLKEKKWTVEQGGDIDLQKCFYINNGVDLDTYTSRIQSDVISDPDLEDDLKFNVLYAGAIRPVNNVGNLLDAATIISRNRKYSDIQFLIYGDGSELQKLQSRVKNEKLSNVKLKGHIPKQKIPFVLSKSSVNILNYSQSEYNWTRGNSSNKLFEYMASGKPIISTVKMGYSLINRYKCGVELDECTPQCLADAIIMYHDMNNEKRAEIGRNAQIAAKDFDFSILTEKLEKVILNVISEEGLV